MTVQEEETLPLDGAGIFSSYADLGEAVADGDGLGIAFAAAGAGLDTLAFCADPVGELASAGFGWLIEHVWFLREPLDAFAGDPAAIRSHAQEWERLGRVLHEEAGALAEAPLGRWLGEAGNAYRATSAARTTALRELGAECHGIAGSVVSTGAWVGTIRALLRDTIADWLAKLVTWGIAALAGGPAGLAAALPAAIAQAVRLAARLASRVEEVIDRLSTAARALQQAIQRVEETVGGAFGGRLSRAGQLVEGPFAAAGVPRAGALDAGTKLGRDGVVEAGKQDWQARQEVADWAEGPAGGG